MRRSSRILIAIAALSLGLLYWFPLWHISLHAPQYPEGLGLYIGMNQIRGQNPNDLNSINGLNHYIGMKPIHPDDIPELKIMPWVVRGLILFGLLVAALNRRWLLNLWVGAFVLLAGVGLWDFWRWEYDYGHNLDPHAAIKVPGMSYQPPLLGSKQMLNINASSWPAAGGWVAIGVVTLAIVIMVLEMKRARAGAAA
ncbi:MAG: hypothetical protein AB7I33_13255 [Gemmatimonadales bacterium]